MPNPHARAPPRLPVPTALGSLVEQVLVISSLLTADFSSVKTSVIHRLGNCEETISRTDESEPRPKYIFNKCGTNIYFFTLQRFGPSYHRILNRSTIIKRTGRSPPLTYKEDKNKVFSVNALVVSCFIS